MTDATLFEVIPARRVDGSNFPLGVIEFPFSVGRPNAWVPAKSYFRISSTIYGAPAAGPVASAPVVREMIAFADNAVGNMFDNAYVRSNNVEISSISQGLAQASALSARLGESHSWLKSLGSGAELNKANFTDRVMYTSEDTYADGYFGAKNEMYRPTAAGFFNDAEVSIDASSGVITGANTLFLTGMPNSATGAPTGESVVSGDILVIDGVYYPIIDTPSDEKTMTTANLLSGDIDDFKNWYIIRKDDMRAPQANSQVYSLWRPPIGLFSYSEGLGSGEYRIQLNPNSNYLLTSVETKNPDFVPSADGLSGTYSMVVNDVRFYAYIEKVSIPDSIQDLSLMEYQVQSKPWSNNLQFSISPYTRAITIFVQDVTAGASPLCPPSMFKVLDNSDLKLATIQVSYAGMTKPSTAWQSSFYNGSDQLQQRYRDTYEDIGRADGAESYCDWLQRGPIYHFNFERDASNRATEVMVNTTFTGLPNGPGTGLGSTGLARVFCVSHFQRNVQITTAGGSIVNVVARNS